MGKASRLRCARWKARKEILKKQLQTWAIINTLKEQKWEWSWRRGLRWSRPEWDSSTWKIFVIQGSSWTRTEKK